MTFRGPRRSAAERTGGGIAGALDLAQAFLAARPRSEREVQQRLARGGFTEEVITAALARLRHAGLLDDSAFATYWLEQRQTFRPRGARLLRAELRQHGIASELAASAAATTTDEAAEDAYRAALKAAIRLAEQDEHTFRTKLGQLLARRGFDWDTITPVVERLRQELSTSSDSAPAPTP
jgi:regulatory protein